MSEEEDKMEEKSMIGWFTYDSQEELPCSFVTKTSDPHLTFAVYEEEKRYWDLHFFLKKEGERAITWGGLRSLRWDGYH